MAFVHFIIVYGNNQILINSTNYSLLPIRLFYFLKKIFQKLLKIYIYIK